MGNTTANKGWFGIRLTPDEAEQFDTIARDRYNRNRKQQLTVVIQEWIERELKRG